MPNFLGARVFLSFLLSEMLIKPNHNKTKNIIGSCEPDREHFLLLTDMFVIASINVTASITAFGVLLLVCYYC